MKTNTQKNDRQNILDLRLDIGNVLCDINKTSFKNELYVVIGKSYLDVALIKMYEHSDANIAPANVSFQLSNEISASADERQFKYPLYADLSRLITRKYSTLILLLNEFPNRLLGKIHSTDLVKASELLLKAKTISQYIKNKYL